VCGRVQGVGFRLFVLRLATSCSLTGYVRNLRSGDAVEVVACGGDDALENLLAGLRAGPSGAHVIEVKVEYLDPAPTFPDFRVRY